MELGSGVVWDGRSGAGSVAVWDAPSGWEFASEEEEDSSTGPGDGTDHDTDRGVRARQASVPRLSGWLGVPMMRRRHHHSEPACKLPRYQKHKWEQISS